MTPSPDPDAADLDRLQTTAGELYVEALTAGGFSRRDKRFTRNGDRREDLDTLLTVGLLSLNDAGNRYLPADPSILQSTLVAPMGQSAARLLDAATSWSHTLNQLALTYRRENPATPLLEEIHGIANINAFLTAALGDAQSELLTAQPDGGRPAAILREAIDRDLAALERGVQMRTLYQHSARRSQATRQYVDEVVGFGGQVRTLDEFFHRLIVIDRRTAVIPGDGGPDVALVIREPGVVAYLADIFERYWERARGFSDREARTQRAIAEDIQGLTTRLLIEGHSDNASAKRLGVSMRTYAGYVAALKMRYEVDTRFQLGYEIGRASRPADSPTGGTTEGSVASPASVATDE